MFFMSFDIYLLNSHCTIVILFIPVLFMSFLANFFEFSENAKTHKKFSKLQMIIRIDFLKMRCIFKKILSCTIIFMKKLEKFTKWQKKTYSPDIKNEISGFLDASIKKNLKLLHFDSFYKFLIYFSHFWFKMTHHSEYAINHVIFIRQWWINY